MKRTTIKLPDELDLRLRRLAGQRGMTVSELTRTAIERFVHSPQVSQGDRDGRRVLFGGQTWRGGDPTLARRIDEILEREYADHLMRESGLSEGP